jgi:uncharacterized protein (TIRG00374 family)
VDLNEVWIGLKSSSLSLIFLSTIVGLSHNIFRCIRWRYLLNPLKRNIGFYNLFSTTIIGYTVSWLIPGRLGEIVRPVLLGQREKISKSAAFATIVIERYMDGLAVVFLFGVSLFIFRFEVSGVANQKLLTAATYGGIIFLALAFSVLTFLLILVHKKGKIGVFIESRKDRPKGFLLRKLSGIFYSFVEGASVLKNVRIVLVTSFYSVIVWLVIAIGVWLGIKAANVDISFSGTFIILPLLVLGIAIPTPGGVGSYHEAMQLGLMGFFGVAREAATSAAILMHAITTIPVIFLGLALLWIDGLSLGSLRKIELSERAGEAVKERGTL